MDTIKEEFGNSAKYMVIGYGETALPDLMLCNTVEEAQEAVMYFIFGPAATHRYTPEDRLAYLDGFNDEENVCLELKFEIGGISVEKVCQYPLTDLYHLTTGELK